MTNVAILGLGVVGGGVYEVIKQNGDDFSEKLNIKYVLDKRSFLGHELADRVICDYNKIICDPTISVVVETMGGASPAFEFSRDAILAKKSVVTSNKLVVEKHGAELEALAAKNGVSYLYEAAVGGGIPLIHPLENCFKSNKIKKILGILNGTTNFILYKMEKENMQFSEALKLAQKKGYAEADPTADVGGFDTARKICILASIAFKKYYSMANCSEITGINQITTEDIKAAAALGRRIKLLGAAEKTNDGISLFVAPCLVKSDTLIANTNDVFNAVSVTGNTVGEVLFYGQGAGSLATASAVVSDVFEAVIQKPIPTIKLPCDDKVALHCSERIELNGKSFVAF